MRTTMEHVLPQTCDGCELEELISRATREVKLYEEHMGIKIYRTYLTFYVRYRKWLHGARAYQLLLLEKYKDA